MEERSRCFSVPWQEWGIKLAIEKCIHTDLKLEIEAFALHRFSNIIFIAFLFYQNKRLISVQMACRMYKSVLMHCSRLQLCLFTVDQFQIISYSLPSSSASATSWDVNRPFTPTLHVLLTFSGLTSGPGLFHVQEDCVTVWKESYGYNTQLDHIFCRWLVIVACNFVLKDWKCWKIAYRFRSTFCSNVSCNSSWKSSAMTEYGLKLRCCNIRGRFVFANFKYLLVTNSL